MVVNIQMLPCICLGSGVTHMEANFTNHLLVILSNANFHIWYCPAVIFLKKIINALNYFMQRDISRQTATVTGSIASLLSHDTSLGKSITYSHLTKFVS